MFLSYSRRDAEFAVWLRQQLEAAGLEVFRDIDDTLPGEEWWSRLKGLITDSDSVVFVLSPNSVASKVCGDEIEEAQRLGKRIFPAVIAQVDWSAVPEGLAKIHSVYFDDVAQRGQSVAALLAALATDISWVREHTRLGGLATRWETRGRPAAALLRGAELAEAERWLSGRPASAPPATGAQMALLATSRRAATRRQQVLVGVSLAVAAVSIGLGVWAEINRRAATEQERIAIAQTEEAERQRSVAAAQRDRALKSQSEFLANAADGLLGSGTTVGGKSLSTRNQEALLLAYEAVQPAADGVPRPYVQTAGNALGTALLSPQPTDILYRQDFRGAQYSPDGSKILIRGYDSVRLADAADPADALALDAGGTPVRLATFSESGAHIAVAGDDNQVRLWKTGSTTPLLSYDPGIYPETIVILESDGKATGVLVTGEGKAVAYGVVSTEKHEAPIDQIGFRELDTSPSGDRLAMVGVAALVIGEPGADAPVGVYAGELVDIEWRPGATDQLAALWTDGTVTLVGPAGDILAKWAPTEEEGIPLELEDWNRPTSLAFSPDGKSLVVAFYDAVIFRLDAATLVEQARAYTARHSINVHDIVFDPLGGMVIATARADGYHEGDAIIQSVTFFDPETLALYKTLPISMANGGKGQISPAGDRLIADDGALWDLDEIREQVGRYRVTSGDAVLGLSADGALLALRRSDGTLRLADLATGKDIPTRASVSLPDGRVRLSADGRHLFVLDLDGVLRRFDLPSGDIGWTAPVTPLVTYETSPDGSVLGLDRTTLTLWAADGAVRNSYETDSVLQGAVLTSAGDRAVLLTGTGEGDPLLRLVELAAGKIVWEVKLDGTNGTQVLVEAAPSPTAMALSPDGKLLAMAIGGLVMVYDMADGHEVTTLVDHRCTVTETQFLTDRDLLTTSADQPATIWRIPEGTLTSKVRPFEYGSMVDICWEEVQVRVLAAQSKIAVFDTTGITEMVPVMNSTAAMVASAAPAISRCLTRDERSEYFLDSEPPSWCITGPAGGDDPSSWQSQWPYDTPAWTDWLTRRRAGENTPMPAAN